MAKLVVTGHRKILPYAGIKPEWPDTNPAVAAHHFAVRDAMCLFIINQIDTNCIDECVSGMALGADQLFADAVIILKDMGYNLRLIAAVPFQGQESSWPAPSQNKFRGIISRCDNMVHVCPPGYAAWKMQKRNEWMVDRANMVLAVWDGSSSGGTFNCISYAKSKQKPIIRLDPFTLTLSKIG